MLFPTIRPVRTWGRDDDRSYLRFPPLCHVANRHVEFSGPAFSPPAFVHMPICFPRHGFLHFGRPADPARRAAKRRSGRAARNAEGAARDGANASDPCQRPVPSGLCRPVRWILTRRAQSCAARTPWCGPVHGVVNRRRLSGVISSNQRPRGGLIVVLSPSFLRKKVEKCFVPMVFG